MSRIQITDIPLNKTIDKDDLRRIKGGITFQSIDFVQDQQDDITVMFNPSEISINKTVPWKEESKENK